MIIPAVIPNSLEHLTTELGRLSFAPWIQIDIVDGKFVPFTSWPYEPAGNILDAKALISAHEIEVDLMVKDMLSDAKEWKTAGAKRLIFHIESLDEPSEIFVFRDEVCQIGLAINNDTPLEKLYPYIGQIDLVQLMGIAEIGKQGQPFDSRVLEGIITLRSLYPDLTISIDGGVNTKNIAVLKQAGADRFVSGSAILNVSDPEASYKELSELVKG